MKKITTELQTAPLLTVNDNTAWMHRIYNKYQKTAFTHYNQRLYLFTTFKIGFRPELYSFKLISKV